MLARDVMSTPVIAVGTATPVEQAAEVLVFHGFTAAPVLDEDDRLVGIVTEADLLKGRVPPDRRRAAGRATFPRSGRTFTVAEVMTSPVESLTPGADLADAARMMIDERIRAFPIVDGERVVGIITRRDLLRTVMNVDHPAASPNRTPLEPGIGPDLTVTMQERRADACSVCSPGTTPHPQVPAALPIAARSVGMCVLTSLALLMGRRVHLPRGRVGTVLQFADGTTGRVYRETVVDRKPPLHPCVLVVRFRLRLVGGWGHRLFRWESLLNTPLFVGFPGFGSKLWVAHDETGFYRGVYEWDGPGEAEFYARALWRVLALVSTAGSIGYQVVSDARRDDLLAPESALCNATREVHAQPWATVVAVT